MAMTFKEFTLKYRDTINPVTGKPWTLEEIMTTSGLSETTMKEFTDFWDVVQRISVAAKNRMPTIEEIIIAHDGPLPVIVLEPPKPVDRTKLPRTPWNPTGTVCIAQLTVPQFEDLMIHILKEHFSS